MLFPWMHQQWQLLRTRYEQNKLPHALLLNGLNGLGKFEFAKEFAQSILCESPQDGGLACQECRHCTQFQAETHPDFLTVEPEEPGKAIKIDQIRQLIVQFNLASHHNHYRVAIINPAEAMNQAAANSLLKSLEEPPAKTLIMLVTSHRSFLPATILSRCQQVDFTPPGVDMALNWLNNHLSLPESQLKQRLIVANGAPLKALNESDEEVISLRDSLFNHFQQIALAKSPAITSQSSSWLKSDNPAPIQWLYSWVSDLIKLKNHRQRSIVNSDKLGELSKIEQQVELEGLFAYLDKLTEAIRLQKVPLNKQMVIDELFLSWQSIITDKTF